MVATDVRHSILQLEKQYWDAMKARDGKSAAQLTADRCVVAGPQGVSEVGRGSIAGMVESGSFQLEDYTLNEKDARFLSLGDDSAVLAYPVHERAVVDGKPMTFDAYDLSVWVRRGGQWLCTAHTETYAEPKRS